MPNGTWTLVQLPPDRKVLLCLTQPVCEDIVGATVACGALICGVGTLVVHLERHSDSDSLVCSSTVLSRYVSLCSCISLVCSFTVLSSSLLSAVCLPQACRQQVMSPVAL